MPSFVDALVAADPRKDACAARSRAPVHEKSIAASTPPLASQTPQKREVNVERESLFTENDLPPCCLPTEVPLWSSHPRVFLPLDEAGVATCPYCASEYRRKG